MNANDAGRRRARRVAVDLDGTLAGRRALPVRVLDLSLSGCLIRCDAPLDAGAIFDLALPLQGPALSAKVQVVESSVDGTTGASAPARYLAGLAFLSLPAQQQTQLRLFLEEQRQRRRRADTAAD